MKKIYSALLALSLSACVTSHQYTPAPQSYRPRGDDRQITITGQLDQKLKDNFIYKEHTSKLTVFFDGVEYISGHLDAHYSGEFTGSNYNGKPTSASCSTKFITQTWGETRCIIFIDNERAATLTM